MTTGLDKTTLQIAFIKRPGELCVPWAEVEKLLGRPHEFTADDDQKILDALAAQGIFHPPWAGGWFSEEGWCIERRKGNVK